MHIAILGRQADLSLAELNALWSGVSRTSPSSATIDTDQPIDIQRLGGSQKIGTVSLTVPSNNWQRVAAKIASHYTDEWKSTEGKITLGLSVYDFPGITPRDIQKIGIVLKSRLKKDGVSLRLVPNQTPELSTATSHHNKLGLSPNKIELLIVRSGNSTIIAESTGSQNISALAARDQGRPKRDAFVGMLPPKLAQMMINMALGEYAIESGERAPRVLDPFCGTGVLLQEALLMGLRVQGTDLADKMIDYTIQNLSWLKDKYRLEGDWHLAQGDAMDTVWQEPIDAVATETYLGQPFSAPPSPAKLQQVRGNCNHIIEGFLQNLHGQIQPGTRLCIAVPAWKDRDGRFTHLPLTKNLSKLGYSQVELPSKGPLLYYRPDQVVARELLVLTRDR